MSWLILGMTAYPEAQKKCQEELDRVIGRFRMPTLADRDSLPYICATLREALRWRPIGPIGELLPQNEPYTGPSPVVGDLGVQHYTMEVSPTSWQITNILLSTWPFFQDDWYEGFFIPKGTICLANIWYDSKFAFLFLKKPDYLSRSMNRDPTIYVGRSMMSAGNPLTCALS